MLYYVSMKLLSMILISLLFFGNSTSFAQVTTQQDAIKKKEAEIKNLEQQINQYQNKAEYYSGQARTLNTEVSSLNNSQKILQTSLKSTNTKIERTNLTMNQNIAEIKNLSQGININRQVTTEMLRKINIQDERSILEILLKNQSLSDFLKDYQDIAQLQSTLRGSIQIMRNKTIQLSNTQKELEEQRQELKGLSGELSDKNKILADQKKEKDKLLKDTKGKESEYKKIVQTLQQQVEQINSEIREYESSLKFSINTQSIPPDNSEVFSWPLQGNVVITQRFGKTVDSKRLYLSGSHSGTDFRAAVGTPIYAVADGVIEGTGNTDLTCNKASFGKWIFIRHNNGLSTAYGHLSGINVSKGQIVKKGQFIGYSGNTGHTTGPHLHLTVYATHGIDGEEGARITELKSNACEGKNYTMPLASPNAYLNAELYLPKTGFKFK